MEERATDVCSITIAGDICPRELNCDLFQRGDVHGLFGDLLPLISRTDLFLANLESPLIDTPSPFPKVGPVFGAPTNVVRALQRAQLHAVNLANNHIMDHGPTGLRSTLRACGEAGIACFGAGEELRTASQVLIREVGRQRIAFLGMAEREFSIGTENQPGANPLDLVSFVRLVRSSRGECDSLVVLLHAGAQHYPLPSPNLQRTCRFMVEEGASAVICQHSHCPGAYEVYHGAPIVYGQGNFIADSPSNHSLSWHQGYLVKLTWNEGAVLPALETVPYMQSYDAPGARRMKQEEESPFRKELDTFSQLLGDEKDVRRKWLDYCLKEKSSYLSSLRGHGRWLRRLNHRVGFVERSLSRREIMTILNTVRCDSHNEALITILEAMQQARLS